MLRSQLFAALGGDVEAPDVEVRGLCHDSRAVEPGFVFVAVPGHREDGSAYAAEAVARGAIAVVAERPLAAAVAAPVLIVPSARGALARLAATFHGDPARRVRTVGITGTKGKTTTTYLLRSIIRASGRECGLAGTIAREAFGVSEPADTTTADPITIQRFLAALDRPDAGFCAMEVSSHALCQQRVEGLPFAVAAFTNLSGDHLDYHDSLERYLEAKAILFDGLRPGAAAVVNARQAGPLARLRRTRARLIRYGIAGEQSEPCEVEASAIEAHPRGTRFVLALPGEAPAWVGLQLVGRHNVENALCAAASAWALGLPAEAIRRGLEDLAAVPGRLEPVETGQPFRVLVDYAHTDDALRRVLEALRPLAGANRLICVFGCGGDRDRTKRPRMARAVEAGADLAIVTSDNPRTEDPARILGEVQAGFARPEEAYVEPDRRRAIARALLAARPGDLVLIAGKGHETYQIIGRTKHPFDDRAIARELLERMREAPARPEPHPAPQLLGSHAPSREAGGARESVHGGGRSLGEEHI